MKLQNLRKAVCKNTIFKYLLNKYEGEDANYHGIRNRNINANNNNYNFYTNNANNRNNANFYHGICQGWRTGRMGNASRWNTSHQ